jgi:hypothetical protein
MKTMLNRFARWLAHRTAPAALVSAGPAPLLDAYRRHRAPSPVDLLGELKNTAWACASINAAVCAALAPRLYVATAPGQTAPRCRTRALEPGQLRQLQVASPRLAQAAVEEVVEHPLLTLFRQVNPVHNSLVLWHNAGVEIQSSPGVGPNNTQPGRDP